MSFHVISSSQKALKQALFTRYMLLIIVILTRGHRSLFDTRVTRRSPQSSIRQHSQVCIFSWYIFSAGLATQCNYRSCYYDENISWLLDYYRLNTWEKFHTAFRGFIFLSEQRIYRSSRYSLPRQPMILSLTPSLSHVMSRSRGKWWRHYQHWYSERNFSRSSHNLGHVKLLTMIRLLLHTWVYFSFDLYRDWCEHAYNTILRWICRLIWMLLCCYCHTIQ